MSKSQLLCDSWVPYLDFVENQAGAWEDPFETWLMVRVKHGFTCSCLEKMFLHPLYSALTSHETVACGSCRKYQTSHTSSGGASYSVSDKWGYLFSSFLKESGVTGCVAEISCCAKDINEAQFSTLIKLSWCILSWSRCLVELGWISVEIIIVFCVLCWVCNEILSVYWLCCDCGTPPVLSLALVVTLCVVFFTHWRMRAVISVVTSVGSVYEVSSWCLAAKEMKNL